MRYVDNVAELTRAEPDIEVPKPARRAARQRARRRSSLLGRALFVLWLIISLLWTGLVAILVFRVWEAPTDSDRVLSGIVIWLALSWLPAMGIYALGQVLPRLFGRWRRRSAGLQDRLKAFVENDPF